MAQAMANDIFEKQGILLKAASCGVFAMAGGAASAHAVAVLSDEYGLDLSGHASSPVRPTDVEKAAAIIAMTRGHKEHLLEAYPQFADKIYTLDGDVADPFGGSLEIYKNCAFQIKTYLEKIEWGKYL
jgi:protein-tyrosine-phosphatase